MTRVETRTLLNALEYAWSAETSFDPSHWSSQNPAWGQCAVTALIIQDHFGGDLLHGEIGGISHYWNHLPPGRQLDLTRQQFGVNAPEPLDVDVHSRQFVLSFPDTRARYERLLQLIRARLESSL